MFDVKSQDTTVTRIAKRTSGQRHGPVTRLMSPSDFGRLLKPFVFLDLVDNHGKPFAGFGFHPHSGIATLTYIAEGSVRYEDTNGATGLLPAGGVEWMRAGGGVWHGGGAGARPRRQLRKRDKCDPGPVADELSCRAFEGWRTLELSAARRAHRPLDRSREGFRSGSGRAAAG